MSKKKKLIFYFIISLFIFLICFYRFYGEKIILTNDNCEYPMLWLHAAGSQERLKLASEKKYCGVEIDTTFSSNRGLIASYNKPNDTNVPNLEELISSNTSIKYWWLDLKNLNYSNAKESSKLIKDLSLKFKDNFFLIESHNFIGLWFFDSSQNNIYKTYWLAKGPYQNNKLHLGTPFYYLRSVLANIIIDPDFVSMFHYQVNHSDFLWIGTREKLTFTVNKAQEYKKVSKMGVSVILTDNL